MIKYTSFFLLQIQSKKKGFKTEIVWIIMLKSTLSLPEAIFRDEYTILRVWLQS